MCAWLPCPECGAAALDARCHRCEPSSPEILALAGKALASLEARRGEDVAAWAERLAADVAEAND